METTDLRDTLASNGWRERALPGYIGLIGPLWTRKEAPGWAYGLLVTPAHLNPAGVAHGGLLTSLLDHALSTIAWEALERRLCVTVQLDTQFLAAATAGQFVEVRAEVVQITSSLVFMQGRASIEGAVIATASAILKQLGAPRSAAVATPAASGCSE